MSALSDAVNKVSAIIREIKAEKDSEIQVVQSEKAELAKELAEFRDRFEKSEQSLQESELLRSGVDIELVRVRGLFEQSETEIERVNKDLTRIRGLFDDQHKQFKESVERSLAELKDRDQHVARLLRVTDELQGEIDVLKDGYAALKADSARASVEATERSETARKAFEEALDNLKGENLALSAKLRGKQPEEDAKKSLAKEAAEALRERTFQTWDRKKYLGLLNRLDEAAEG